MANRIPPPPIEHRGPPGRGQPQRPSSRPPPPPNLRPGPAQGQPQPFPPGPMPFRPQQPINSTLYVDITPQPQLDDETCKKKLTTYVAISIRKVLPRDAKKDKSTTKDKSAKDKPTKDKGTWAKAEHTREAWSPEEIAKQVKKLSEGPSVTEKKQKLGNFQQGQVNRVLDSLKSAERSADFEWSLAQIDQRFQNVTENGKKKKETHVITVYAKRTVRSDLSAFQVYTFLERMKQERAMAARPPPQQQQEPARVEPVRVGNENRRGRRRHDDSSSFTDSSSETDSDGYSSSENTTYSSRSGRHSRSHHRGRRGRSHSRHRQYHRGSYITDVPRSPMQRPGQIPWAPEVPRALVPTEEVTAAYQRGRIDADTERLGLVDPFPRARPLITTGVLDRIPADPRFAEDRYADELQLRHEERMRQRELADIQQRVFERTRLVQPHPFAPRYGHSEGSWVP